MAQVDFYILSAEGDRARDQFACRLIAKAYQRDHRIHVRIANAEKLDTLNTLLWTYYDKSFVPHDIWPHEDAMASVTLGLAADGLPDTTEVCINFGNDAAPACGRVAEIVSADPKGKSEGRARYAQYRERGCDLHTHQIKAG